MPAPAPLPGKVIGTDTRQPIAGAWVWPQDDPGRFTRADEQGAYRIEGNDLGIAAAGHLSEVVDGSMPWPEGGLPPVALDSPAALVGTVVDGEGKPAAGAEVTVFPASFSFHPVPQARLAPRIGRVSALGEVRIAGLGPGFGYHVVITGPGFAPAWLEAGRLKARENRFKAVVARAGRVLGRIEDGEGRPVAENHGRYLNEYTRASRTDADGNYRLEFPKPGLEIDSSSLGISRHGRAFVEPVLSARGDKVLEADGRSDHRLDEYPEPLAPTARSS